MTKDPVPLRKLVPAIPQELETICLKALEKAADQRYDTARAMAEDLRSFLNDMPIAAKRPGTVRRVFKFARRHRAMVTAVTALVLVSLASIVSAVAVRKSRERERESTVQGLFSEAERLREAHEWSKAAATYNKVLSSDASHLMALVNLAIVRKEQYNAALPNVNVQFLTDGITLCERAIQLEPNNDRAWNTKGVLLKMSGRFDEAIEAYKRVRELKPDDPYYWANMAQVNVLQKDLDLALDNLHRASESVNPREKYSCNVLRDMALVEFMRGDSTAQSNIARAYKCDATERTLLVQARMRLISPQPDYQAARDETGAAVVTVQEREVQQFLMRYLALANLRLQRFAKARDCAEEALSLGDMPTYNKLIVALAEHRLGQLEKARQAFQESQAVWPEKLAEKGEYVPSAIKGFLWFESADELLALRSELERLLPPT